MESENPVTRFGSKKIVYDPKDPKYELTTDTIVNQNGAVLYRIRAIKDFSDIKSGQLGGYVGSYDNLNLYDDSWIDENSSVSGAVYITDNSYISWSRIYTVASERFNVIGNAFIYKCNIMNSTIYNPYNVDYDYNPKYGLSQRYFSYYMIGCSASYCKFEDSTESIVLINSRKMEHCTFTDDGDSYTYIGVEDLSNIDIPSKSFVTMKDDLVQFTGFGSRYGKCTFAFTHGVDVIVKCGCYHNTLSEFRSTLDATYGSDYWKDDYKKNHYEDYKLIADLVEQHFFSEEAKARRADLCDNKASIDFEDIHIPVQYNGIVDYYDLHDTINRAALSIIGK